jgi:hypothetical protein
MGLELKSQYHSSLRYFCSKTTPVYYTIWLPELFTESHTITVIVELDAEGMKYLDGINKIEFDNSEQKIIKETARIRKSYIHYASQSFRLNVADIKNLTEYLYQTITTTSSLQSIFTKIESKLLTLTALK